MKLLRYGAVGMEQPGLLDDKGRIHALSPVIDDLAADSLSPTKLREIGNLSVDKLPIVPGTPRLGTPYRGVGKFVAGDNLIDDRARAVDSLARFGQQQDRAVFNRDFPDSFQRKIITVDVQCVQESLRC